MIKRLFLKPYEVIKGLLQTNKEWTTDFNKIWVERLAGDYSSKKPFDKMALKFVRSKSRVLSAGCGSGREVRYLVRVLKCKVLGIDVSQEMISRSMKEVPEADYKLADISSYKSPEKFDFITCMFNTINYLSFSERKRFVENSYENLKKGGLLIMTTMNKYSNLRAFINSVLFFNKNYFYSPSQITKWFEGTGFLVKKTKVSNTSIITAEKA
jgi:cyclopropane fatty-acyl-phospholipid synthase-like methyltransferase